MRLYVFNPDADMALGNNEENYMAPATIRRMAEDLALLPAWYAQPGSGVLAPSAYNADFLKQMKQLFRLDVQLVTEPELRDCPEVQVVPWGWNPAIRKRMLKGGVPERRLPDLAYIHRYRALASRPTSVMFYAFFDMDDSDYVCGGPALMVSDEAFPEGISPELFEPFSDGFLLKSVWSSSGKGLRWCRNGLTKSALDWCKRMLKEDGAFMIELIHDKVEDFAMEFYSDGKGKVLFTGYSRFVTDEKGSYQGNLLMPDSRVEEWIRQYVPLEVLVSLRSSVQRSLEVLIGRLYTGFLGVDMMVCRQQEGHPYAICPCVEINLRMNMGIVAHTLCDRFVAPGSIGLFSVDGFPTSEALQEQHAKDMQAYPLKVEEGRVVSGYLPLVPITPRSRYRAFVRIDTSV